MESMLFCCKQNDSRCLPERTESYSRMFIFGRLYFCAGTQCIQRRFITSNVGSCFMQLLFLCLFLFSFVVRLFWRWIMTDVIAIAKWNNLSIVLRKNASIFCHVWKFFRSERKVYTFESKSMLLESNPSSNLSFGRCDVGRKSI